MPPTSAIPATSLFVMGISMVSVVVSFAMFSLVLWQAPKNATNRLVALYLITVIMWATSAFLARFMPILGFEVAPYIYMVANSLGLNAILLFAVATQYADLWGRRWPLAVMGTALLYLIILQPLTWGGRIYTNTALLPSGRLSYDITPLGLISFPIYAAVSLGAVAILWRLRRTRTRNLIGGGIASFLGMATSLFPPLTLFAIPIICAGVSSLFFARAILRENLFNPLISLNKQLAKANADLEQANRLKSQFLANMSHELRTPLNSVIGYTELVLGGLYGPLTDTQGDRLTKVLRNAQSLLSLINDILDLSRIEAGRMELKIVALDVGQAIDIATTTVFPMAEDKGLTIRKEVPARLPMMLADDNRLNQILINLLSNAVKFTHEGEIIVRAEDRADRGMVSIHVIDTGIGIAEEMLETIFDEFSQADGATTREYGGTGLGLTISRRLARMHGGNIKVASKTGQGSTFTVSLPATKVMAPGADSRLIEAKSGPLVLVIDDEPEAADIIRVYLTSAGYRVEIANDGQEGLNAARTLQPDIITLDIMMPGIDGWGVLERLKDDPQTESIPVVIVSIVDHAPMALEFSYVDHIMKPVDKRRLTESIRRALISSSDQYPILVVDDNADDRDMMSTILSRQGYNVAVVEGGQQAIDWLGQHTARMVLLDLMMPRVSGFDVLAHIRSHPVMHNLPVIVVTAKELTLEDSQFLNTRFTDVVRKQGLIKDSLLDEIARTLPSRRDSQPSAEA